MSIASKLEPLIRSSPSAWSEPNRRTKKCRKETFGYKRYLNSGSGGPEKTPEKPLHRTANKVSRSEDQKQMWSTTAFPGEERRSELQTVPISRGSSRICQLQEIRIRLYRFIICSFE
ncbi:hypothetical protein TNCV_2237921 [Trichonephila clavipes]|nr:hypothetical protein TNCV_2237921 [Trichonephila clavipes]